MRQLTLCAVAALFMVALPRSVDAQTIKACVQKSSQQVRIIDNSESCRQTENAVVWNVTGPAGPPGPPGPPGVMPPPQPQQLVVFEPGWQHAGSPSYEDVTYFKDASDVVHLQGLAGRTGPYPQATGGVAQLLFTLPVGYRPARAVIVAASGNCTAVFTGEMEAVCRVDVLPNGKVYLNDAYYPTLLSFTSISFRAQ